MPVYSGELVIYSISLNQYWNAGISDWTETIDFATHYQNYNAVDEEVDNHPEWSGLWIRAVWDNTITY